MKSESQPYVIAATNSSASKYVARARRQTSAENEGDKSGTRAPSMFGAAASLQILICSIKLVLNEGQEPLGSW